MMASPLHLKKKEIVCVPGENNRKLGFRQRAGSCSTSQTFLGIVCSGRPWAASDLWNRESVSAKGTVAHLFIWNTLKTMSRRKKHGSLIFWYSPKTFHVPCIEQGLSRKPETSTHNRKISTQGIDTMEDGRSEMPYRLHETTPSGPLPSQKPEKRVGMVREPRAWGHQGKAEARRRAQALSEMLPDAGREKEKSQAAPFFLPAHLLSAPSIDWNGLKAGGVEAWERSLRGHSLWSRAEPSRWEDWSWQQSGQGWHTPVRSSSFPHQRAVIQSKRVQL